VGLPLIDTCLIARDLRFPVDMCQVACPGVTGRRRLDPAQRYGELVEAGAALFAEHPYDDVRMDDVATRAGVSRALLYRHFPAKRDLFEAVYRRAADRLLATTELGPSGPLADQVAAGLDAHIDYFVANRNTVLAANRVLAGDPKIQAVIDDELAELQRRLLDTLGIDGPRGPLASATLWSWLVFVRTLCVDWLADPQAYGREELRAVCAGALLGALDAVMDGLP
jgi:AcrR family transcriptional regulator